MQDPAATLKQVPTRAHLSPANMPARSPKFLYPSGSTPLAGYTIKRGIGVGGFGEVYFAISDAGKEVALKRILRNLDVELRGVRQCLNLKHVNLISLWDIQTNEDGESWVVMEYLPGKSLRDMLNIHPKGLPQEQVKTWFASIAAGVAYLHEKGIVHRDLKPGNIFYDDDQKVVKIGDYGLSKFISCSRRSGQTESVGTFHYMAPEIGNGDYGKGVDVYAMGIILFELLTGDTPFNGESSQEIIMKHLTAMPDLSTVPAEFRTVIGKSLHKDADLRYGSVPELLVDLPWPDLASKSENIVAHNSIGTIGSEPGLTEALSRSGSQETSNDDPDAQEAEPAMLRHEFNSQPGADIIFGQVHLSSPGIVSDDQVEIVDGVEVVSENQALHHRVTVAHESGLVVVDGYAAKPIWQRELPTPIKIVLVAFAAIACVLNSKFMVPVAIVAAVGFAAYFLFRVFVEKKADGDSAIADSVVADSAIADSNRPAAASEKAATSVTLSNEEKLRKHIGAKDFGDKSAELLGSVLIGTVASIVICSLSLLRDESVTNPSIESIAVFVWMVLVSSLGVIGLLCLGKLWESGSGGGWKRWLSTTLLGALIGGFAYAVSLPLQLDPAVLRLDGSFVGSGVLPQFQLSLWSAYLIFFAAVFGTLKWWRQADPIRSARLRMSAVGFSWILAVVLSLLVGLNPIWHGLIALATSVSVQLSAPWLSTAFRRKVQTSNAI